MSKQNSNKATAPYNFIPLNKKVIGAEIINQYKFYDDRYNGTIKCQLKTITPIFIGNDEINKAIGGDSSQDFFNIEGKYLIPGSSIKGMLRTLVEIVSYSKLTQFNDEYLYYRTFADENKTMRELYKRDMVEEYKDDKNNNKYNPITKGGYLKKIGLNYYIIPAKEINNKSYHNVKIVDNDQNEVTVKVCENERKTGKPFSIHKLDNNEYLVISGKINNKLSERVIHEIGGIEKQILVTREDIISYREDKNRNVKIDLLKLADNENNYPDGVPCFFRVWSTENGTKRVNFGHTVMFRKSYNRSIGLSIKQENKIDIAEVMFGKIYNDKSKQGWKGRVAVTDAYPNGKIKFETKQIIKTLGSPKPTSVQLYIDQSGKNLKTYNDSDAQIRGHKMYWHRSGKNWAYETQEDINNRNIEQKIHPISKDNVFNFEIKFNNLSEIELGALLFVVDLPEGLAHKLGKGKSRGLGSVKISAKLNLIDINERYTKIFNEDLTSWEFGSKDTNDKIIEFKSAFEEFIKSKILDKTDTNNDIWSMDRFKELKLMLDVHNLQKEEKIEYMPLKEFRKRNILPNPDKLD